MTVLNSVGTFKESQLQHERVRNAFEEKLDTVKSLFEAKGLRFASPEIFLRAFKTERELEVWIRDADVYRLLVTYPFCTTSGNIGPKRKEGDLQIPEGIYRVNHFNPASVFHLSLGINYPNASDRILGDKQHPGGAIYVHGNCVSIGCIPITDDKIKELYVMAVEAKNGGQENIPVHIFPARLNDGVVEELVQLHKPGNEVAAFWKNLQGVYADFEGSKKLRPVKVNSKGEYYF